MVTVECSELEENRFFTKPLRGFVKFDVFLQQGSLI